mmetsp:Transcript_647/g.1734  ORF Transcript_647/g.1734 Transcript_647/m.1734 type:complete len:235 (-) Transcript_647:68-772(-)
MCTVLSIRRCDLQILSTEKANTTSLDQSLQYLMCARWCQHGVCWWWLRHEGLQVGPPYSVPSAVRWREPPHHSRLGHLQPLNSMLTTPRGHTTIALERHTVARLLVRQEAHQRSFAMERAEHLCGFAIARRHASRGSTQRLQATIHVCEALVHKSNVRSMRALMCQLIGLVDEKDHERTATASGSCQRCVVTQPHISFQPHNVHAFRLPIKTSTSTDKTQLDERRQQQRESQHT